MGWAESFRTEGYGIMPGRDCGACEACCVVLRVDELDKPAGTPCAKLAPGGGCSIYRTRPGICRGFYCHWQADPSLGPEWRPEASGFILIRDAERRLVVKPDRARPFTWRESPYIDTLRAWSRDGFRTGFQIVAYVGREAWVVLPDREEHLGVVPAGATIATTFGQGPDGPEWGVKILD